LAKAPLNLVPSTPPQTGANPPRTLGNHGLSLWNRIMSEYDVRDAGGVEMLTLACEALDRAEALRGEIERDGPVLRGRGLVKEHPGLKHELAARSFVVRTLHRLGLDVEPIRAGVGRPGGHGSGWSG
jgi:hypothetical protein